MTESYKRDGAGRFAAFGKGSGKKSSRKGSRKPGGFSIQGMKAIAESQAAKAGKKKRSRSK